MVPEPSSVPPSMKLTVPVTGPTADVSVAVNVTLTPAATVAALVVSATPGAAALLTTCASTVEVDVAKLPSPEYTAVTLWVAVERPDVVYDACPPDSVPVPSTVAPSINEIEPVGAPEPLVGATVALKVTDAPCVDGFSVDDSVVVVAVGVPLPTVSAVAVATDVLKKLSPLYAAVIGCDPAGRLEIEKVATPLAFNG